MKLITIILIFLILFGCSTKEKTCKNQIISKMQFSPKGTYLTLSSQSDFCIVNANNYSTVLDISREGFDNHIYDFLWLNESAFIYINSTLSEEEKTPTFVNIFNIEGNKSNKIFQIYVEFEKQDQLRLTNERESIILSYRNLTENKKLVDVYYNINPQTFELTKISGVNLDSKYYRYYKDRVAILNETNISIYENEHLESIYFDLSKFTNKSSNSILSFEVSPSGRYIALEASKSACARELAGQICSTAMILLYDRQTKMIILEDSGGEEIGLNNRAIYAFSPDDKKFIYLFSMEPLSKLREVRLG